MKRNSLMMLTVGAVIASAIFTYYLTNSSITTETAVDAEKTAEVQKTEEELFLERKYSSPAGKIAYANRNVQKRKKRNEQGIKYATLYMEKLLADPVTGKIDQQAIYSAREYVRQKRQADAANPSKRALGLNWEELGPDNIGGRTRGFLVDNVDSKKLFTGGVTGGLFFSEDEGLTWQEHPYNTFFEFLSISSIKQASNGDIYVGTGESFVFTEANSVGHLGGGVWKSTDRGLTFALLSATQPTPYTANDPWSYVNELAVDPNNPNRIYASTSGGLQVTSDGGTSWTRVSSANGLNQFDANARSEDVAVDANGHVFAYINNSYYRSEDGDQFTLISGSGNFPTGNISRMEFAISPQDPNYVYVAMSNNADALRGIYQSTDNGINWNLYSPENSPSFNPLGGQGSYDLAFNVTPDDKEELVIGGQLELWKGGNNVGWDLIAFWQPDSPTNPFYVHADMHGVHFDPKNPNTMYIICDGGVFKTETANDQFPRFVERNKGYNVTQYYNMWADISGEFVGGTQDNGTIYNDFQGNTVQTGDEVNGGDGGHVAISAINPLAMFAETPNGAVRRSSNRGESFSGFFDTFADVDGNGEPNNGAEFIAPFELWENVEYDTFPTPNGDSIVRVEQSVFMLGGNGTLWFTPDALNFSDQPTWYRVTGIGGLASSIGFHPDGTVYVGTSGGRLTRIQGLKDATYNPATNTVSGLFSREIGNSGDWGGGRYISGIAVDKNDPDHILVTLTNYGQTNYVFKCTECNTITNPTFTSIQSDLPKVPVYSAVIDVDNPNNYILGTDLGVWASPDKGASWTEENTGFVSTPVFTVRQQPLCEEGCNVIYAGSYGRGIFRTTSLTAFGCATDKLCVAVGIDEEPSPVDFVQFYPNPVINSSILDITLSESADLTVIVTDLAGRTIQTTNHQNLIAGTNKINMNFTSVASGFYLVSVLENNKVVSTKRVNVIK